MLGILGRTQRTCQGWSRRHVLQAGGAGLFGMSLPKLMAAEDGGRSIEPRARSVIFLMLFGGPSRLRITPPHSPEDLAATIDHTLCINPETRLPGRDGRLSRGER